MSLDPTTPRGTPHDRLLRSRCRRYPKEVTWTKEDESGFIRTQLTVPRESCGKGRTFGEDYRYWGRGRVRISSTLSNPRDPSVETLPETVPPTNNSSQGSQSRILPFPPPTRYSVVAPVRDNGRDPQESDLTGNPDRTQPGPHRSGDTRTDYLRTNRPHGTRLPRDVDTTT